MSDYIPIIQIFLVCLAGALGFAALVLWSVNVREEMRRADVPKATADGQPIKLRLAWAWACPSCGHANYHHGSKMKPEDMPEGLVAVDEEGRELEAGDFVTMPETVWCRKCEGRHPVVGEE